MGNVYAVIHMLLNVTKLKKHEPTPALRHARILKSKTVWMEEDVTRKAAVRWTTVLVVGLDAWFQILQNIQIKQKYHPYKNVYFSEKHNQGYQKLQLIPKKKNRKKKQSERLSNGCNIWWILPQLNTSYQR